MSLRQSLNRATEVKMQEKVASALSKFGDKWQSLLSKQSQALAQESALRKGKLHCYGV
jgi:hypothetical protein